MMNRDAQLEQLLSERGDGLLSSEDRAAVERAMARNDDTARSARAYERLSRLLFNWRVPPETIDWNVSARQIAARTKETVLHQRRGAATDRLVQQWAKPMPHVDWMALASRISSAVRSNADARHRVSGRHRRRRRIVAAVPLATAAVVAFAVLGWRTPVPTPSNEAPRRTIVLVSLEVPEPAGTISITVDRGTLDAPAAADDGPMGQVLAFGPKASELAEPGDDAFYY
ncbi:MAG: hypothetical protein ACE5F9_04220 [Phycisphaerae bacterium]